MDSLHRKKKRDSKGIVTVLIVDDSLAISHSLRSILGSHGDIEVIGVASDGEEAVARAVEHRPDVVLMDAQMPGMNGVEATRIVKRRVPETKVLFMAVHASHIDDALEAGADGFMMKDATRQELLLNIRKLAKSKNTPQ
ncbi:MAG: response regulator transcription factor [Chloroflexi bacterium]|nr:response regulator transcription factor [Chloroflexota bacterium]